MSRQEQIERLQERLEFLRLQEVETEQIERLERLIDQYEESQPDDEYYEEEEEEEEEEEPRYRYGPKYPYDEEVAEENQDEEAYEARRAADENTREDPADHDDEWSDASDGFQYYEDEPEQELVYRADDGGPDDAEDAGEDLYETDADGYNVRDDWGTYLTEEDHYNSTGESEESWDSNGDEDYY